MSKLKRPAFVRDGVGVIRLTQGYETIVDIYMLPWVGDKNWLKGRTYPNGDTYAVRYGKDKQIRLHREVLRYHGVDIPEGLVVDHINRNPLDNRFENLRVVTKSENATNSDRSDRVTGVRCHKDGRNKKYEARIRVASNTERVTLGHYLTFEKAREVYLKEVKKLGRIS